MPRAATWTSQYRFEGPQNTPATPTLSADLRALCAASIHARTRVASSQFSTRAISVRARQVCRSWRLCSHYRLGHNSATRVAFDTSVARRKPGRSLRASAMAPGPEPDPRAGNATQKVILVFTKYPTPGFAKTRLIPALGPRGAAQVSARLTVRCVQTVAAFARESQARVYVYCAATPEQTKSGRDPVKDMRDFLTTECDADTDAVEIRNQCEGDLGDRLTHAFQSTFEEHPHCCAVVVGTDIPEVAVPTLRSAFDALDTKDVVVGPAEDGGYYLLGTRAFSPAVFERIQWSTSTVLSETIQRTSDAGLTHNLLKTMRDIDVPEDLPYLRENFADFRAILDAPAENV